MQPATFILRRVLSGKTLKQWRKANGMSAQQLAVELGVSRSYIKSIEGGSLEASQKLIQRFDALRAGNSGDEIHRTIAQEEQPKPIRVISRFDMPATIEILARPRRCAGCKGFFVPITPNQKMHNSEQCRRAARRRKTRKDNRK